MYIQKRTYICVCMCMPICSHKVRECSFFQRMQKIRICPFLLLMCEQGQQRRIGGKSKMTLSQRSHTNVDRKTDIAYKLARLYPVTNQNSAQGRHESLHLASEEEHLKEGRLFIDLQISQVPFLSEQYTLWTKEQNSTDAYKTKFYSQDGQLYEESHQSHTSTAIGTCRIPLSPGSQLHVPSARSEQLL